MKPKGLTTFQVECSRQREAFCFLAGCVQTAVPAVPADPLQLIQVAVSDVSESEWCNLPQLTDYQSHTSESSFRLGT